MWSDLYTKLRPYGLAASRWLNRVTGGDPAWTFSAWSWLLHAERESAAGTARVLLVDLLNFDPIHCLDAYEGHVAQGLHPELPQHLRVQAA